MVERPAAVLRVQRRQPERLLASEQERERQERLLASGQERPQAARVLAWGARQGAPQAAWPGPGLAPARVQPG